MENIVDEKRVADFERDGYLIIPNAISMDVIEELIEAGDRWVASDRQKMRQRVENGQSDGFRNAIGLDEAFTQMLAVPTVLPYLVRLLGPDIKLLTSHLLYRERAPEGTPANRRIPGWHRDFAQAQRTLGHERILRLDIKAAFALSDIPGHGYGGTMFLPGSHTLKKAIEHEKGTDPEGAIDPAMKAGDCVLFENRTWHAAGPNLLGPTRKALMMGYTYVWIQSLDYSQQPDDVVKRTAEQFGDIGLQLLGALPEPEHFDFNYDSKPLRDWEAACATA